MKRNNAGGEERNDASHLIIILIWKLKRFEGDGERSIFSFILLLSLPLSNIGNIFPFFLITEDGSKSFFTFELVNLSFL